MATLTPINTTVNGNLITPITPGADAIPCSQYRYVTLVARSASTGTPTITVDDPTSSAPAGTGVTFNADVTLTLTAGQLKSMRLDCARFRDANGNINYTTATPGDSVVYALGHE